MTALLEPVVGLGKVRATAHVELDFDKVKTNEESYNPAGQVERETKVIKDHEQKSDTSGGVPGTSSNVAPAAGAAGAKGGDVKDHEETDTHFEISKVQRSVEQAPGTMKRMSIAVIVDNASQWDKDAKGEPVEKPVPRTPDELKKIRDQVSSAVGFQAKRGDDLTVENIAFAALGNPKEDKEARQQRLIDMGYRLAPAVLWSILGLIIFFLVVLPLLKRLSAALSRPTPLRVRVGEGAGPELNAEGASGAPEAQRRSLIKKRIQESTTADAETIASLVRSWIIEDGR